MENKRNLEEEKSILDLIEKSSSYDNSDDEYISTYNLEDIWYVIYVYLNINARYARLKIRDHIRQLENEWKGTDLSAKHMGKGLHNVFKAI